MFLLLILMNQFSFAQTSCSFTDEKSGEKKEFKLEFFDGMNLAKMKFVGPTPYRYFVADKPHCLTQVANKENDRKRPVVEIEPKSELCVEQKFCGNTYTWKLEGKEIELKCKEDKCSK